MGKRTISLLTLLMVLALMPLPGGAAQPTERSLNNSDAPLAGATIAIDALNELSPDDLLTLYVQLADAPAIEAWQQAMQTGSPASAQLAAQAQLNRIEQNQLSLLPQLKLHGATPLYRLQRVLNSIVVEVRVKDVPALAKLPGVMHIERVPIHTIENAVSVPLIGAPELWDAAGLGLTGEGITVGVIDTGVDYLHTHFGGSGLPADYAANDTKVIIDNIGFPSLKVVGGWDFAGDDYNADPNSASYQPVPKPDPDPMDCNGHGSHVAGTAAGYGVNADGSTYAGPWDTSSVPLSSMHIGPGVAPQAEIYALRVFGCAGSTSLTAAALEWATDPNGDGNFDDHLDVVNMSLGSSYGSNLDLSARATNNTVAAGVIVVASAGNSGDYSYVTGSPGAADWAISTASSVDSTDVTDGFVVNVPAPVAGIHPASLGQSYNWAVSGPRTGDVVYPVSQPGGCQAFNTDNSLLIAGKIVLLDWTLTSGGANECGSATRANNVAAVGGIGVIMIWPGTTIDIAIAGNATIPSIITNKPTGDLLKAALGAETVNATLTNAYPGATKIVDPARVDALSSFTSRGIRRGGALKPDVAAPGQSIFSANSGTGRYGRSINGTSMAAPHVAGSMALLRELHPDWSIEELKALIMNTAHTQTRANGQSGLPHSPARQGAGRVMLPNAASASAVAYNADEPGLVSISYGTPQVLGTEEFVKTVRVTNKGSEAVTYDIEATEVVTSAGVTVTPLVASITVEPGASETFSVRVTVDAAQLDRSRDPTMAGTLTTASYPRFFLNEHTGYITLTPASGTGLRVPFFIAPRPASDMAAANVLDFGTGDTASVELAGAGVNQPAYISLAWALQLQEISPNDAATSGLQDAGDLAYIGVGSNISQTGTLDNNTTIFFGVAAHGPWSLPSGSEIVYNIYIDTNRDGTDDYRVFNATLTDGNDVFVTAYQRLSTGQTFLSSFLNGYNANVETAPMNSSMMVLPVTAGNLGLTAGNSRFNYYIRTSQREYGANADISAVHSFDPAAPALNALPSDDAPIAGRPLFLDLDGSSFDVQRNQASWAIDQPQGLLLLHHFNTLGSQAEVVPLRTFGVDLAEESLSDAGKAGTEVSYDVTITNTGNAADVFDISVSGNSWSVTAPLTVEVAAGASETFQVEVMVPVNSPNDATDTATLTATSQADPATSDTVTITTSVIPMQRQYLPLIGH